MFPERKRDRPLSSYFETPLESSFEDAQSSPAPRSRGMLRNITNTLPQNFKKWTSEGLQRSITLDESNFPLNSSGAQRENFNTVPIYEHADENEPDLEEGNLTEETDVDSDADDLASPTARGKIQTFPIRKAARRALSVLETPKEKNGVCMANNSHLEHTSIRTFKVDSDLFPHIDEDELNSIVEGRYDGQFDEIVIIDCRFNYEYEGGHVARAVNISSQNDLERKFLRNANLDDITQPIKKLLIFHCEFSACRGPNMARHLRRRDRQINSHHYPKLAYPDIVILAGGYCKFYEKYKNQCVPQAYVEMKDIKFQQTCDIEMDKVRRASKLTRLKSNSSTLTLEEVKSNSFPIITSRTQQAKILKKHKSELGKFGERNDEFDDDDFDSQEDLVSRARHRKFYSFSGSVSSSFSIASSALSNSLFSGFDSSLSLSRETSEESESGTNLMKKNSVLNPMARKPVALPPQLPLQFTPRLPSAETNTSRNELRIEPLKPKESNDSGSYFSFPKPISKEFRRNPKLKILALSTPLPLLIISPKEKLEIQSPSRSSLIDPFNESPVDFSVPCSP